MQDGRRDTDVQNRLLDFMGEGEGGWSERTALKHVYYLGWNRSPVQIGCMRQVLGAGALGRPRGMGWGGRWEGGSGWGTHVNPWLIHVNIWQKWLQYCKVISLQLIKINEKKNALLLVWSCFYDKYEKKKDKIYKANMTAIFKHSLFLSLYAYVLFT